MIHFIRITNKTTGKKGKQRKQKNITKLNIRGFEQGPFQRETTRTIFGLAFPNKDRILFGGLNQAFRENSVSISDCRAF